MPGARHRLPTSGNVSTAATPATSTTSIFAAIEVWGIHPSEAVPVDALLASLAAFSHCGWNYMYVND
jgi:hypothetical protein